MARLDKIEEEVKRIYKSSNNECIRDWFFENHVRVVASYAKEIANKVGADPELSVLGSLFHDIARAWDVNDDPALMDESLKKTEELMKKHGYSEEEIKEVKDVIIPHSCRDKMPATEEAKVMATADALAHLMTDFYVRLPINRWLLSSVTFEGYREWLLKKN